ncbi:hypothetical protein GGR57DRAFT_503395 [Xylariaceae sp. FL1272]|nr:hypothetical protein GGR57DRAFT_503395 [Xylariaceae sp. FL1272]
MASDDEINHIQIFTAHPPQEAFPFPTIAIRIRTISPQDDGLKASLSEYDNTLLAGIFFGIAAALLVIALPLAIINYFRARRLWREGRLQI